MDRDAVKGLREVYGGNSSAGRGFGFIEPICYCCGEGEEGGGGGVEGFEAMLGGVGGERGLEGREKKSLEDLDCRAEEGDWAVGRGEVRGFARFEERDNGGEFPNGGDVGMGDGKVEEGGKEGNAIWTKVLQVKDVEVVRTYGCGVG